MSISYQSAVIMVKDVVASRQFYEGLLGQTVQMDFGLNVTFAGGFAIWQVDHAHRIAGLQSNCTGQLGRDNLELYFETEELASALARVSDAGVEFVHPVREQPWGQRVFRCYDPDGHMIEIGEPMPIVIRRFLNEGMAAEEVAERTSMPLEIVRQVAGSISKR